MKTYFIIESLTTFCGYTGTEAEGCSIDRVEFDRCMNPVGQLGSGGGAGGPGGGGGEGFPPNFNTASPDSILSNSKSIITNNKSEISTKSNFSLEPKISNTLINFQLNSILSNSNTCQCRIILDTKLKLDNNCMPCPFRNYDRNIFTFVLTIMYSSMFFILVNPVQLSKNIMNRIFEDNQINSNGDKEGGEGQNNIDIEDLENQNQNSDYEVPNANRNNNNNKVVFQTKTSRLGKDSHSHGSSCSQNKSQSKMGRSSRLKQQISNNLSFMSNNSNRTRTTETSSTSCLGC